MEGGTKSSIDLESSLDINTSDMLVSVSNPTFQHNWQRYQGKFLPNSLRFEKNGWAAGWNVYNFNYNILRIKLADNVWVQLGALNKYVKLLTVYDSQTSAKALAQYVVIPETLLISGDVSLVGNRIQGKLNNKSYTVDLSDWSITEGFALEHSTLPDKTETLKITDSESSINIDFNLLLSSALTGDQLDSSVPFGTLEGNTQSWDNYVYDTQTNIMTTPEGASVSPVISDDNLLTFDYVASVTDNYVEMRYILEEYYPKFTDIMTKDQSNDDMHIGVSPSLAYAWDFYKGTVTPKQLLAADEEGIVLDWQLPLWATCGFNVTRTDPNAKLCDNTRNYEVAVRVGSGLNTKVKWINAYSDDYNGEQDLADNYRVVETHPQYITDMLRRFNQILVGNTIEKGDAWNPNRHTVYNGDVWYKNSRQYANLRGKKTAVMTGFLGNVYTWGSFTFKATSYFEQNNPWDWTDTDNCVYTVPNISNILSVKRKGTTDSTNTGDDAEFVNNTLPVTMSIIARLTGYTTDYSSTQAYKSYSELYSNGVYVGGTYETVGISTDDSTFWPFEKVPKFNLEIDSRAIKGVYWTDGSNYIDDFDTFRSLVLGEYDHNVSANNSCLVLNDNYSRKRVVKTYKAGYDFDWRDKDAEDYFEWKKAFDTAWQVYYPDYTSPTDIFDNDNTYGDSAYLDFDQEETEFIYNVDPGISFVAPGVYAFGNYAVPYNCFSGLIIYDDNNRYEFSKFVNHHTENVTDKYNIATLHADGAIYGVPGYDAVSLPYYFGDSTSESLVYGNYNSLKFVSGKVPVKLKSAALALGINYSYTGESGDEGSVYNWNPQTPTDDNWFGNVLLTYTKGRVIVEDARLNSGVEQISEYYVAGDINDGVKFAWPIWGHSALRVLYPEMKTKKDINSDGVFVVQKVPMTDLTDINAIYWDRNDTDKSIALFNIKEQSRQPDDMQGGGKICFELDTITENSVLWYRKKETDQDSNEIKYPYYIPGICYNGLTDNTGHLDAVENLPVIEVNWVPNIYSVPTGGTVSYKSNNSINSGHRYFTEDYKLINPSVKFGLFDAEAMRKPVYLYLADKEVDCYYDAINQITVFEDGQITLLDNENETVKTLVAVPVDKESAQIYLNIGLYFNNNKARFYRADNATLKAGTGDQVTLSNGSVDIKYNMLMRAVTVPVSDYTITDIVHGVHVHLSSEASQTLNVAMKNYSRSFTFEYRGNQYTVDIGLLSESEPKVQVLSTDIKTNKTKVIGEINSANEYQLLRQQWNTTIAVENFWWIDDSHVLELSQDSLTLKRKTGELDDWNGDRFEKLWDVPRGNVLPTKIRRYFVTNGYSTKYSAFFCTLETTGQGIKVAVYNVREKFELHTEFYLKTMNREIGSALNSVMFAGNVAYLNTYNVFDTDYVLSKAEWSNTVVGNMFILGVHLSNNFDQWAVVYNLDSKSITRVIQGYGYVGLKGDLTGGQIPDVYFDVGKGFNDTVYDLKILSPLEGRDLDNLDAVYEMGDAWKEKLNNIEQRVVGTADQQWYISTRIHGIVSHLKYNSGTYEKQLLPITNNYTATFGSPSWSSAIIGDNMIQIVPFSTLFQFPEGADVVWNIITSALGQPLLYSLAPRYCQICYLNMTLGQYAYVHYNSSRRTLDKQPENDNTGKELEPSQMKGGAESVESSKLADPVLYDDLLFDKQKFSQNLNVDMEASEKLIFTLLLAFGKSLQDTVNEKLSVNDELSQSAVSDFGRKFTSNALLNVSDMLASNISTKSRNLSAVTGIVTGIKSLDMFYSTSDNQKVIAGPGFVEHQFVADCIAQSSTTVQVEGRSYQFYWALTGLTLIQLDLEIFLAKLAADNLKQLSQNWQGATGPCGVNYGAAIAVALTAAALVLEMASALMEVSKKYLAELLDVLNKNGITVNQDATVSRHSLSTEGKHKYGEKNETFMWPCWGIERNRLKYTDEWVESGLRDTPWTLALTSRLYFTTSLLNAITMIPLQYKIPSYSMAQGSQSDFYKIGTPGIINGVTEDAPYSRDAFVYRAGALEGRVPLLQASCYGNSAERTLPDDMAKVEGVQKFLPTDSFRNENIAVSEPVFPPSLFQDYKIDESWDLGMCCTYGHIQWINVKDTKITNCAPSNMYISEMFCGVATSYSAIEVKRGLSKAYMRPYAITPNVLAMNCTGYNSILDNKLYHAFDGTSYRIVDLIGSPGLNKNMQSFFYSFQKNDRFKRSNKFPANELQGNFKSEPMQALDTIDELFTLMTVAGHEKGLEGGTIGEDKDAVRWSIPVFTEPVTTLPAAVKTLTAMTLNVYDGITALTTNLGNNQTAYKAPLSIDFTIGKNVYRQTEEYICSVTTSGAIDIVEDIIPSLGLVYIGSTPTEAYFYSSATRHYYMFTGSNLTKMNMMERFRNIQKGYWDFVNQEVIMPCLMTFKRLNAEVEDKDTETDNIIVPVLSKGQISGEVIPPLTTIFNDRSWYRAVSLPAGFAYQGPNRVIINRTVFCEYMLESLKDNFNKWSRMGREKYTTKRIYPEVYDTVDKDITDGIDGWTYNPFVLVTSALGNDEDTDCIFEWVITFCWPVEMDLIYGVDNYAVVNVTAETMTPGGKVKSRPTHIFLTKEQFTRTGNYGYYSFRYQSKNGAGNRERLHIWSDQYIAISKLDCEVKPITSRRHEPLVQQLDVQKLKEL